MVRRGASLRDFVPLAPVVADEGWYSPRRLEVHVQDEGECDLRLDLEVRDGGVVECHHIEVRRRPGGRAVTTSLLRGLPLEQIGRRAVSAVAMQRRAVEPGAGVKLVSATELTRPVAGAMAKGRRGRPKGHTEEVRAEALRLHKRRQALVAAGEKQPVRVIRQELGPGAYSRPYVYKLLNLGVVMENEGGSR